MYSPGWPDEHSWQALLAGVQEGDSVAVLKLHHWLVPDIEWLLRRYSVLRPRRIARQICHDAVAAMHSGRLTTPEALSRFMRQQIAAFVNGEETITVDAPPDLTLCPSPETEVAIRYYVLSQDQQGICADMQISPESFCALKKAAREIFRRSLSQRGSGEQYNPAVCIS